MKKVFSTTKEVCIAWANQRQAEGRTGSNTSFRGRSLYSYGTQIARIVDGVNGPIALVDRNSWSSGTSKVQGEAKWVAKNAQMPVFLVWNVGDTVPAHLEGYGRDIEKALLAVENARNPGVHRQAAWDLIDEAKLYAATVCHVWTYQGREPGEVLSRRERAV